MKIVLGLGNPGKRYERTRHNLGFLVLDQIAFKNGVSVGKEKHQSLVCDWRLSGEKILLVKPQTYMNRSGEAVSRLFRYYEVSIEDLVVIHDDLDLPLGRIRVRQKGGAGGHKGILSILERLGDDRFFRVRVGIGRPPQGVDPTDYVLQPFSPEEERFLAPVVSKTAEAVETLLVSGPERAMQVFNRREERGEEV